MASGFEELLTGRTLVKRYTIREVIGRGGFAVVYCADDLRLGRPTAVKVLSIPAPTPELREHLRARFEHEARAAAALPHHPNVVPVYDFGTDPETGIDFIVMELLRGENVAAYLAREGRPPLPLALRILRDAAEGIAVGHRAGLIHRDVKPGNLFLAEAQGEQPFRVCVLDFGIARLVADDDGSMTRTQGAAPLSPAYASPEQLRGDSALTPATDVYALGVVGYQLLTGKKPFGAERDAGSASSLKPIGELNPQVPPGLAAVIERAMLPEPGDRFADADAFAAALDAAGDEDDSGTLIATAAPPIMDDEERTMVAPPPVVAAPIPAAAPVPPRPAAPPPPRGTPAPPPPPPRRKRPAWMLVLPLLLLGLVAGLWAMNRGGDDVDRSPGVPADSVNTSAGSEPEEDPGAEPLPVDPGATQPAEDPGGEPVQVSPTPINPDGGGDPPVFTQPAPQPRAPAQQPGQVAPRPAPVQQPVQRQPVQRPNLPPQRQAPRRPVPQQPQPQQPQPQPPQPQPVPPQPQPQPPAPQPVPPQPQPQPPAPQPPAPTPPPRDTIVLPPAPTPPPPSPPGGGTAGGSGTTPVWPS